MVNTKCQTPKQGFLIPDPVSSLGEAVQITDSYANRFDTSGWKIYRPVRLTLYIEWPNISHFN